MIACKIAAMVPDRVLSLALLNAMGGDFQCFPEVYVPFIILWKVLIYFYGATIWALTTQFLEDVNYINDY